MSLSLILACIWAITANVLALIPSRDNHWFRAYVLIGVGLPILAFVVYENGPWWGLFVLFAAMSVLRWPMIYLGRWVRGRFARG